MRRATPKLWRGTWIVDLRPDFGQRYTLGLEPIGELEATHLAYAKLDELRGGRMAELAQPDLFADQAPKLFAAALDAWQRGKRPRRGESEGSRRYVATYARVVRRDLGERELADFGPPLGTQRLVAYVRELEARGNSGRTIRNKLSVAEQVLRYAFTRAWLTAVPLHPAMPPKAAPVYRWITESMFRALRDEVFRRVEAGGRAVRGVPKAAFPLYCAQRKLYLSWLFYTGVHHHDADHATSDWLFLDGAAYVRHNHKTHHVVPDQQFEMPAPLVADFRELQAVQGREFFPGECFTGGPWPECAKVMQAAAARLGFPDGANPSILRRSYAREMFLRGYDVHEVAERMGHVSEVMLRSIYIRLPRPTGHAKSRWTLDVQPHGAAPTPSGMARVLQIKGGTKS